MKITYNLLASYLSKQCTEQEQLFVDNWLLESPQNKLMLEQLQREWVHLGEDESGYYYPPKKTIKHRVLKQIYRKNRARRIFRTYRAVSWIASILLVLAVSLLYYKSLPPTERLTSVGSSFGNKTQIFLADGTEVMLNAGSQLTYSNLFGQENRKLQLEGEAYFKVQKDPSLKCVVQSGAIEVEVVGTSFNMSSHQQDSTIEISLYEGSINVNFSETGQLLANLNPDEMIVIRKSDYSFQLVKGNIANNALWTQSSLRFHNEDIGTICTKLEKWYGVRIHLNSSKSIHNYSFVVKSETLKEVFDLLDKITPLTYQIKGKEVYVVVNSE